MFAVQNQMKAAEKNVNASLARNRNEIAIFSFIFEKKKNIASGFY